ncbi:tripartite tricarboxylate transporter TctB family protein [Hoeflea alexandrii]|uniref:tripartite tricarboxylate transporter TctB family protein n=1 Tax=Hoeflea alexandrii TaxID=288436 RepID=UPI0022AF8EDF|nr:tripartite tricarboxylate transporter TctB family protein [Hoeflea alexandrii]MCZ4291958.1 tripartite tricarboxylate transporter TctB family protein [Hoeflea alexandrii]
MSGQSIRRPGELVFACLLVIFSAAALWQAYGISGFKGLSQPGVFPMLAAATMLVSCLFVLRDTLRARETEQPGTAGASWSSILPLRLLVILAMVAIYLYAMPWLGFVLASGLFLFSCIAYLWRKGIVISLALSIASLAAIYFLFRVVFEVVLPQGSVIPAGVF